MRTALAVAIAAGAFIGLDLGPRSRVPGPGSQVLGLTSDLDAIFSAPAVARALVGIRIESLRDGLLYERNGAKLVVPASNMKILTLAVAAERLGWDYKFETRLEARGTIADGTLTGDLVVTGTGDPSILSQDFGAAALFGEWAEALRQAGIRRVTGRLIGDDNAFDDDGIGAGWAWDYLADGYAAPAGALSYNENNAVVRVAPGRADGDAASIEVAPPGNGLVVINQVRTGAAGSRASVSLARFPGSATLTARGSVPASGAVTSQATTVDNPTLFFVEGLRIALLSRGIVVRGGGVDIDDVKDTVFAGSARLIARRESLPLSSLGAHFFKVSQNFYGEMFLKTIGRAYGGVGTAEAGRRLVRETLGGWGISADSFVMYDGSGLSRYDYVTADAIVAILKRAWQDEKLRGPFLAALPVGGHDGTLSARMKDPALLGRVQAKTGSISNMRALSGFLETKSGEKIVFAIIANHFTAPSAEVDVIAERALARVAQR